MMKDKEKTFVSAVIYVHNAAERIGDFLNTVKEVMEENFEHSEIICVNDASDDQSTDRIREIGKSAGSSSVTILNMSYYHGVELAMNAGVDIAIGDMVFEFDNTFPDFESETIMKVYRRALEGYDIVSASPDRKERFSSRVFYSVFERFADLPYKMQTESFRVLSRRVINRISSTNKSVMYRKAVYAGSGLKTDHITYKCKGRLDISDKQEKRYRSGLAVDSLILFTSLGYRFSMAMTVLMMLISIFVVIYTIVTYLLIHPVEGWTTTVLFISVCFFGLFGIQTIIVKYLQLLVDLVFKRKHYSFESIEKLTE